MSPSLALRRHGFAHLLVRDTGKMAYTGVMAIQAEPWTQWHTAGRIRAWDDLATTAGEPNPFYESWYLLPALQALDTDGTVIILSMTNAAGELCAMLPLRHERSYFGYPLPHWRNWVHHNCFFGGPLVRKGCEAAFWCAFLEWSDRHCGTAIFLHLMLQSMTGPLHDALRAALAEPVRPAATVVEEERATLASTLSPQAYLEASLSGKKRKELRRQERRLAEAGDVSIERASDAADIAGWIAEFLELEARGWKGANGSALASDPATTHLFQTALMGAAKAGRLERLALRLDGKPLAMLATFVTPPCAYSFKTAFDETFARFSPGVLLQCENLAVLERADIAMVDSCASPDHPMIDRLWRERRRIASHSIGIGGAARRNLFKLLSRRETGHWARGIA